MNAPGTDIGLGSDSEVVAEETRRGRSAGLAAIVSGVTLMAGTALLLAAIDGRPQLTLPEALDATFEGRASGDSLALPAIEFLDEQGGAVLLAVTVRALSYALLAFALLHLWKAVKTRQPAFSPLPRILIAAGGFGGALFTVVSQIALNAALGDFLSGDDRSRAAVEDINSGPVLILQAASSILPLLFAFGLVVVSLNAMRAGLLTRFMGVLGCFVAMLYIIPLGSPLPLVQTFWLIALGLLFLGSWPRGIPPAWRTGTAVPWPTQQELREQRERSAATPEIPTAPAAGAPTSGPTKRKRKR